MPRKIYILILIVLLSFLTLQCRVSAQETDYSYYNYLQNPPSSVHQYYVSPIGLSTNDGSINTPWDMQTAFNQTSVVAPGDILWLRGGIYAGTFTTKLNGSDQAYVYVVPYPGERAIIDGALTLGQQSQWVIGWGLEVTNLEPDRSMITNSGLTFFSKNAKLIHSIVHDAYGVGTGFWEPSVDSEMYGNLVYHSKSHALYCQNLNGIKTIDSNILLSNGYYNLHCYGEGGHEWGLRIRNNIMIGNNSNVIGGTKLPVSDDIVDHNHIVGSLYLGWDYYSNSDIIVTNNHLSQGSMEFRQNWENITFQGNEFYPLDNGYPGFYLLDTNPYQNYLWDNNRYARASGGVLRYKHYDAATGKWVYPILTLDEIRQFGFDRNGSYIGVKTGVDTYVTPSKYDPTRATVLVYNWDLADSIDLDLSSLPLSAGDTIVIHNALDYFNDMTTHIYTGDPISISMVDRTIEPSLNSPTVSKVNYNPYPKYGVFIIESQKAVNVTPSSSPTPALGDINKDTNIDIQDIIILINEIFTPSGIQGSDINSDGKVDILDVIHLINIIFS